MVRWKFVVMHKSIGVEAALSAWRIAIRVSTDRIAPLPGRPAGSPGHEAVCGVVADRPASRSIPTSTARSVRSSSQSISTSAKGRVGHLTRTADDMEERPAYLFDR